MKYQQYLTQFLLIFVFIFSFVSCREFSLDEESELLDEDMIVATELAAGYLNSSSGRWGSEMSITVLKYKNDKLYYATNTDDVLGYVEVTEETITAYVEPGEHIFWYSGGGVSDLEGIEFDTNSQQQLDNYPEEINYNRMWVIKIPEDIDAGDDLKYDIVYEFRGHNGPPIRLDPKIKIQD